MADTLSTTTSNTGGGGWFSQLIESAAKVGSDYLTRDSRPAAAGQPSPAVTVPQAQTNWLPYAIGGAVLLIVVLFVARK